jgi:uncharacterized YigZ family protein
MTINTVNSESSGEYKSLNSKFIGILMPLEDKARLKSIIEKLAKEHPKACHICYAYRIGYQTIEERANDDGEPSGTAGKPILNSLLSHQLSNVLLMVVRYYGGTKLGVPGLIEAYKEAAIASINSANIIIEEEMKTIELEVKQVEYFELMKKIKREQFDLIQTEFENSGYKLKLKVPVSKLNLCA